MSHALLAIQNILQNSNIFILSRETVLFMPFGSKKVTQFSGLLPTSVSYLNSMISDGHHSLTSDMLKMQLIHACVRENSQFVFSQETSFRHLYEIPHPQ